MAETLIRAHKIPQVQEWAGRLLVARTLRANFHLIWLSLDPAARAWRRVPPARRVPAIFTCTHPSWWDGYLAWLLNGYLGRRDAYLMMDVLSLQHFRFFTWLGVYGIDRADPRAALASIAYSAELLAGDPNRAIWMFPQGTITPPDRRPLALFPGVAHVARRLPACDIVPLVWRLEYRYEQHAEVFIRVGAPLRVEARARLSSRDLTRRIDAALTAEADRLHDEVTNGDIGRPLPGYVPILHGRGSINRVWEALQARARRLAGRPDVPPAP